MKLLRIKPVVINQNGTLVERYEVTRCYTDTELVQLNLDISSDKLNPTNILDKLRIAKVMEKRNAGVVVETFNSYENANWFVSSVRLIKPVLEVLEACNEAYKENCIVGDAQSPNLMVRTPKNLDLAMGSVPKKLLKDIECDWAKRYGLEK